MDLKMVDPIMKYIFQFKLTKSFLTITLIILTSIACSATINNEETRLEGTISVQSTVIAHLSTQVTKQEQVNISQWENIGHLYTQMPYALGVITPMPPGFKPTPTPYSLDEHHWRSTDIEYPPDTRTGIDEIDSVIDVILNKGIDARLAIIRFTTTPCTLGTGLGGPPKCKGEETIGTPIDIFPIDYGKGIFIRPGSIREVFGFSVRGLFAVYHVPGDAFKAQFWPAGDYAIAFTSEDGGSPHIITIMVEDGRIVRLELDYSWPPFDSINNKSDAFILPPKLMNQ